MFIKILLIKQFFFLNDADLSRSYIVVGASYVVVLKVRRSN